MTDTVDVKHTIKTEKKDDGSVVRTETIVTIASSQAVLDAHLKTRPPVRESRGDLWDFFKFGRP